MGSGKKWGSSGETDLAAKLAARRKWEEEGEEGQNVAAAEQPWKPAGLPPNAVVAAVATEQASKPKISPTPHAAKAKGASGGVAASPAEDDLAKKLAARRKWEDGGPATPASSSSPSIPKASPGASPMQARPDESLEKKLAARRQWEDKEDKDKEQQQTQQHDNKEGKRASPPPAKPANPPLPKSPPVPADTTPPASELAPPPAAVPQPPKPEVAPLPVKLPVDSSIPDQVDHPVSATPPAPAPHAVHVSTSNTSGLRKTGLLAGDASKGVGAGGDGGDAAERAREALAKSRGDKDAKEKGAGVTAKTLFGEGDGKQSLFGGKAGGGLFGDAKPKGASGGAGGQTAGTAPPKAKAVGGGGGGLFDEIRAKARAGGTLYQEDDEGDDWSDDEDAEGRNEEEELKRKQEQDKINAQMKAADARRAALKERAAMESDIEKELTEADELVSSLAGGRKGTSDLSMLQTALSTATSDVAWSLEADALARRKKEVAQEETAEQAATREAQEAREMLAAKVGVEDEKSGKAPAAPAPASSAQSNFTNSGAVFGYGAENVLYGNKGRLAKKQPTWAPKQHQQQQQQSSEPAPAPLRVLTAAEKSIFGGDDAEEKHGGRTSALAGLFETSGEDDHGERKKLGGGLFEASGGTTAVKKKAEAKSLTGNQLMGGASDPLAAAVEEEAKSQQTKGFSSLAAPPLAAPPPRPPPKPAGKPPSDVALEHPVLPPRPPGPPPAMVFLKPYNPTRAWPTESSDTHFLPFLIYSKPILSRVFWPARLFAEHRQCVACLCADVVCNCSQTKAPPTPSVPPPSSAPPKPSKPPPPSGPPPPPKQDPNQHNPPSKPPPPPRETHNLH